MKTTEVLLAVTVLGLTGCDGAPDALQANRTAGPVTIQNDYHDRMLKLSELERGAALRTAIRSAGERCDRVAASAFQQDYTNLKMWTAQCAVTEYAVFLAATGDVQVRKCSEAAALKLPICRPAQRAMR